MEWDWAAAKRELDRALELNPNNARSQVFYGFYWDFLGNHEQALAHFRRAVEIEPLNLNANQNFAFEYFFSKQYDQAIEYEKKTLEMDPTFASSHYDLSFIYLFKGKYDLWLEEWEKAARLNNDAENLKVVDAAKREYSRSGYRGALKRVVALEEDQAKRIYIDPAWIAGRHSLLGEKDLAFAWLDKALAEKSGFVLLIKSYPAFDSLRSDPRYADLLKRMGLPQ